jgi:hypothetical protein
MLTLALSLRKRAYRDIPQVIRFTEPSAYSQRARGSLQSIFVTASALIDPKALLTSEQVMDRLLGDARLRRIAMTCVLPAVRCGDEWRYRKSDLDAWIAAQNSRRPADLPKS